MDQDPTVLVTCMNIQQKDTTVCPMTKLNESLFNFDQVDLSHNKLYAHFIPLYHWPQLHS